MNEEQEKMVLRQRERSTALIAILTDQDKAREFERSLTLSKIIEEAIPISVLRKTVGLREIAQALDVQLTKLAASVNVSQNLNDSQIKIIVEDLLDKYPNETIEDFILVFKRARQGGFGTIYHLHSAVIFGWMETYLEEKYKALEKKLERDRDGIFTESTCDTGPGYKAAQQYVKKLNEDKRAVIPMTEKEAEQEGQEKPKRKVYYRPSDTYLSQKERHLQYLRANYDSFTMEKLDGWLPEDQWNEINS